ncbi:MAG: RnfABCDGE type electron transport complex subunit B [Burkholderiales bacterium]|nr:RnfABCDGE type electron transport complex subunit B [Burkholderiales bacterium]
MSELAGADARHGNGFTRLADAIDAILPQTQCTRCGFDACRPYAEAIARGAARLNRCAPGGAAVIGMIAALTGEAPLPLDPACGTEGPLRIAAIDEPRCIGCTVCLQKCPVDAIVGAPKQMHTVIAALCTGCELCVAPCPVDCIAMVPDADGLWSDARRDEARRRFARRNTRLARAAGARLATAREAAADDKLAVIRRAVARSRAKRALRENAR